MAMGQTESDRTLGSVRPEHLVKNRLKEENPKCIKDPNSSEKNDAEHPLKCVGYAVTNKAEKTPHAARTACRLCSGWEPISTLYPG